MVDAQGFTWDLGGHVLFSHYQYFDEVMNTALGDAWVEHIREAWVWMRERWIPYPFQNNIWRLPNDELIACLNGLLDLQRSPRAARAGDRFATGCWPSFGTGPLRTFMFPYNRKVWAYDPSQLDVGWMGERVATVDLKRVLRQPGPAARRCELGAEFDVSISAAWRHRRHLARGREAFACRAASFQSRASRSVDMPSKTRVDVGRGDDRL